MSKILISACLLGQKVRYDGGDCLQNHERLQAWITAGNVVTICPEMIGRNRHPAPSQAATGQSMAAMVLA